MPVAVEVADEGIGGRADRRQRPAGHIEIRGQIDIGLFYGARLYAFNRFGLIEIPEVLQPREIVELNRVFDLKGAALVGRQVLTPAVFPAFGDLNPVHDGIGNVVLIPRGAVSALEIRLVHVRVHTDYRPGMIDEPSKRSRQKNSQQNRYDQNKDSRFFHLISPYRHTHSRVTLI